MSPPEDPCVAWVLSISSRHDSLSRRFWLVMSVAQKGPAAAHVQEEQQESHGPLEDVVLASSGDRASVSLAGAVPQAVVGQMRVCFFAKRQQSQQKRMERVFFSFLVRQLAALFFGNSKGFPCFSVLIIFSPTPICAMVWLPDVADVQPAQVAPCRGEVPVQRKHVWTPRRVFWIGRSGGVGFTMPWRSCRRRPTGQFSINGDIYEIGVAGPGLSGSGGRAVQAPHSSGDRWHLESVHRGSHRGKARSLLRYARGFQGNMKFYVVKFCVRIQDHCHCKHCTGYYIRHDPLLS